MSITFYDDNKTGELMNRLSSDTTVVQNTATVNISMALRFSAQVLASLVMIFTYSWKLSLTALAVVPLVTIISTMYGRMVKRLSNKYQAALAKAADTAQETFSAIRTVRSFAMEPHENERHSHDVQESYKVGATKAMAYGAFGGVVGTIAEYAIALVLWYGGTLVLAGEMRASDLISFLLYTVSIAATLGGLAQTFFSLMNAIGASERVFHSSTRPSSGSIERLLTPFSGWSLKTLPCVSGKARRPCSMACRSAYNQAILWPCAARRDPESRRLSRCSSGGMSRRRVRS